MILRNVSKRTRLYAQQKFWGIPFRFFVMVHSENVLSRCMYVGSPIDPEAPIRILMRVAMRFSLQKSPLDSPSLSS